MRRIAIVMLCGASFVAPLSAQPEEAAEPPESDVADSGELGTEVVEDDDATGGDDGGDETGEATDAAADVDGAAGGDGDANDDGGAAGDGDAAGDPGDAAGDPGEADPTAAGPDEAELDVDAVEPDTDQRDQEDEARAAARAPAENPSADIPIRVNLHGYYRIRYNWIGNVPVQQFGEPRYQGEQANFAFQRLRLLPSVTYGDPEKPIAALYMQIDALDNVVIGDNARVTRTPLFAADPSVTDYEGFDLADTFRLERAWLEFLIPVGQIRVGRMPSQWGLGLLAHDGNGLGEWGDPLFGTTFDRVMFATRPMTIFNTLARGDSRTTPLIYAIGYDKLVEDPVRPGIDPPDPDTVRVGAFGPLGTIPDERSSVPFAAWVDEDNDVQELINALIWVDPDFGRRQQDELRVGGYYVYRWQRRGGALRELPTDAPASRVHILDAYWKLRYSVRPRLAFYSEGELLHIRGRANTVSLASGCDDDAGVCRTTEANIWGAAARVGVNAEDRWAALLEWGFSSGDESIVDPLMREAVLRARPLHPDHHVGLLMYQVALSTVTALRLGPDIRPLWSRGGVWNSHYFFPQIRAQLIPGIEVHAAVLAAWAHKLVANVYFNDRDESTDVGCSGFARDCSLGVEVDLALRVKWGPNELLRWDTELGFMRAGNAFVGNSDGLSDRFLWTVQTRMAMVF